MFLVGLTGGIGAGKSTVAERLAEHGAEIIDADEIARAELAPGTETWKKVVEHFGDDILDAEGFIDRPKLAQIVFADDGKRALLNELTHPPVMKEIADRLELLMAHDGVVVLDVPLLVESGSKRGYDAVVVVAADTEIQVGRLTAERRMSEEDARARIAAQAPLEDKLAVATHVVWNNGSREELLAEVDRLAGELQAAARKKAAAETATVPDD